MIKTRLAFTLSLSLCAATLSAQTYFRAAGSVIALMDSAGAARASILPDDYTAEHTAFDLRIRFNNAPVTEEAYFAAAAQDARSWPVDEAAQLRSAFDSLDAFVRTSRLNLHLPDTLMVIKTTGREEFGAEGWTRRNRIMLNTGAQGISLHLVAHELWHVVSRYNEALRNRAYAVFHFLPCNNVIYKPAMNDRVITNPDCPRIMHYTTIKTKDGSRRDGALVLYSKSDAHAGFSLEDSDVGFLELTGDDRHKAPRIVGGKPVIDALDEVPDLFRQVGMNTQYVLHVEEIAAEHFAALVAHKQLPQMVYEEGMLAALKD